MGEWRYYAQRAGSGLWLDVDVQLQNVTLEWAMSAPGSGEAYVPLGLVDNPYAADGRLTWSKWDTILYAEEDGNLAWDGICVGFNPDSQGNKVTFAGHSAWWQGLPFNNKLNLWDTNAFDAARKLVSASNKLKPGLQIDMGRNDSAFFVGDEQPPPAPKEPPRHKGEKKSDYTSSKRYKDYKDKLDDWTKLYGKRKSYDVLWWEAPYIGEELDSLAKEVGFDYRERVKWDDRGQLTPHMHVDLADDLRNRREDIKLVDGLNLAKPLETKDANDVFANHAIGLGSGEGRDMLRVQVGQDDGRLYQGRYVSYKSIKHEKRLRALTQVDYKHLSNVNPDIDAVVAWDMPGYASLSTLRVGDEVEVVSDNTIPVIDTWRRIVGISRNPVESTVALELEPA